MMSNMYVYIYICNMYICMCIYIHKICLCLFCNTFVHITCRSTGLYILHTISHISTMCFVHVYMYLYIYIVYCIHTQTLYERINKLPRKSTVAWHTSATLRRLPWHTPSTGPEHIEDQVSHQGHQVSHTEIYYIL